MKKFLLLAAAALMVTTAGAQLKSGVPYSKASKIALAKERKAELSKHAPAQQVDFNEISTVQEMKQATGNAVSVNKAPKKAGYIETFYRRPAGMYFSPFIVSEGAGLYSYGRPFLMNKPFADFTWEGFTDGDDENTLFAWDVWIRGEKYAMDSVKTIVFADYYSTDDVPYFYAVDGPFEDPNSEWFMYQMTDYELEETTDGSVQVKNEIPVNILSISSDLDWDETGEVQFMYSSKTFIEGGRHKDVDGMMTTFYGAEPWGDNERGWWFGKNGEHVDGMAQVFEKPEHPYMLKTIYLQTYPSLLRVNAPVKMTCRVYKLNEIPAYDEEGYVRLPLEPGELIVSGEGTVTPTTAADKNGLVAFSLIGQDPDNPEMTYEYTPTIDYPIMICIDGYNDEGMEDLVEFATYISMDWDVDEGYGELAYVKQGIYEVELDENGDTIYDEQGSPVTVFTGDYYWRGLNNFFRGDAESGRMQMKTGLSIFIGTENPFLTFNFGIEDGEYTFPVEGGPFHKTYVYSDTTIEADAIEFFTLVPSEDGDMWITCNGSEDELPDWLEFEFVDLTDENGDFADLVDVYVTAQPLPEGLDYREAVIRFEIPGDFIEYKFMQGEEPEPEPYIPGDVNGDGEVNIADVNCLIGVIQGAEDIYEGRADVNKDGEVNIADVNAVIDIILS